MSDSADSVSPASDRRIITFAVTAVGVFFISMLLGAAGGGLFGWFIGSAYPGYYRTVFPRAATSPDFSPVDVGVGSGIGQGAICGLVVGVVVVLAMAVASRRRAG